jgi:hypothetical protein
MSEHVRYFKQVNDKDVQSATHQEVVDALVAAKHRLTLTVRHDPRPSGFQVGLHQV